ncbi:MAG: hypothetical protein OEZ47_04380 [Gammaproteobacteria bacterium]|nr:hypothetical protein [Gammaproteobacteria bacterium]
MLHLKTDPRIDYELPLDLLKIENGESEYLDQSIEASDKDFEDCEALIGDVALIQCAKALRVAKEKI